MSNCKRKTWRCFHCNQLFRSRKSASAHFGSLDDYGDKSVPACVDPLRADETARLTELGEARRYARLCQEAANVVEEKMDALAYELEEFKRLTKCARVQELRMMLDSTAGEVITARALIEAVRAKAPAVYAEVVRAAR